MSIQADCRTAMHRLAASGAVFTEIDVANAAASSGWSNKHFDQAVRNAYNVLQGAYKKGELVRYGPVKHGGVEDYARKGSKIVYAATQHGPKTFDTPNGNFPRLLSVNDEMAGPGRKRGTSRDDTKPWATQVVSLKREIPTKGPPVDTGPLLKKISQLERELKMERLRSDKVAAPEGGSEEIDPQFVDRVAKLLEQRLVESVRNDLAEVLIGA